MVTINDDASGHSHVWQHLSQEETMFHITHQRKPRQRRVAVLCTLLLLLFSFTLPASASPPQDLSFTFDVTYAPIPTDQGVGAWSSAGVLAGGRRR
ncbi:MAG: hypothetical protein HZY76_00735 [Anaerolineae bacterium]|nr:MAG: hypothetical protein HZY76_00735 [Anaerolineae bacterium]